MLTAFFTTLMEMARISLFLVVGFGLNRLHILPKGAGAGISRLDTMLTVIETLENTRKAAGIFFPGD